MPTTRRPRVATITASSGEDGWRLTISSSTGPPAAIPATANALYGVLACLAAASPRHAVLHAAAMARGGSAVLIAGGRGAGKSTTAALLLERGWQYLSDEFAPLHLATLAVRPCPLPLRLRSEAAATLGAPRRWQPGPEELSTPRKAVISAIPEPDAVQRDPLPVRGVVVLGLTHAPARARIAPSTAVLVLAGLTFHLEIARIDAIIRFARRVPCWTAGSLTATDTADFIERLETVANATPAFAHFAWP
jgi:hypothetical protein